jgi:orotate phosphoribosyltransferase
MTTPWADETRAILHESNALLSDDHFVYISGHHGSGWVDKDAIFLRLERVRRLTQLLAEATGRIEPDILCGPAVGGLIVAQWTAFALGLPAVFAEHDVRRSLVELRGPFSLHRGFSRQVAGRRVLVVDDIVNTGQSAQQTVTAVRNVGGTVLAVAALVDRGNTNAAKLGVPEYIYLLEHRIPNWPAAECPLCRQQVPVNTHHAHGQEFVEAQQGQPPHAR